LEDYKREGEGETTREGQSNSFMNDGSHEQQIDLDGEEEEEIKRELESENKEQEA
jgi:hypothetical protein